MKSYEQLEQQMFQDARSELKDALDKCTAAQQNVFKLMYARDDGRRTTKEAVAIPIHDAVDGMNDGYIRYAMQQVARTLEINLT